MLCIVDNHNHRFAVLEDGFLPIKRGEFDNLDDAKAFVEAHPEAKLRIVEAVDGYGYR